MICKKCGTLLPNNAKFCSKCGSSIEDNSKVKQNTSYGNNQESEQSQNNVDEGQDKTVRWWFSFPIILVCGYFGIIFLPLCVLSIILFIIRIQSTKSKYKNYLIKNIVLGAILLLFTYSCILSLTDNGYNNETIQIAGEHVDNDIANENIADSNEIVDDNQLHSESQIDDITEMNSDQIESQGSSNLNNASDINSPIGLQGEDIEYILDWNYPETFSDQREEIFEYLKSINGTYVNSEDMFLPIDTQAYGSDLVYYGDIEGNVPNGIGVVLKINRIYDPVDTIHSNELYRVYLPVYAGYFKNGNLVDYGMEISFGKGVCKEGNLDHDGYGQLIVNGKGITYYEDNNISMAVNNEEYQHASGLKFEPNTIITDYPVLRPSVEKEGEFKNGLMEGKGKCYWNNYQLDTVSETYFRLNNDCYGPIQQNGQFKDGKIIKGKTYWTNGQVFFNGEFINALPSGKGKLYSKEGNLILSGKINEFYVEDAKIGKGLDDLIEIYINPTVAYEDEIELYDLALSYKG